MSVSVILEKNYKKIKVIFYDASFLSRRQVGIFFGLFFALQKGRRLRRTAIPFRPRDFLNTRYTLAKSGLIESKSGGSNPQLIYFRATKKTPTILSMSFSMVAQTLP